MGRMGQWPPGNTGTSRCKPLKLTQTSTHRHTQTRTLARTQNILRVTHHTATTHKHRHIDTYTTSARVAARSLDAQTHAERQRRQRHASTNRRTDAPCIQVAVAGGTVAVPVPLTRQQARESCMPPIPPVVRAVLRRKARRAESQSSGSPEGRKLRLRLKAQEQCRATSNGTRACARCDGSYENTQKMSPG